MKKGIALFFILLFISLYYSKGQGVRLVTEDHKPIEGAVVSYGSLDGTKSAYVITDNRGQASAPGFSPPMIRRITLLGFSPKVDTVHVSNPDGDEIKMTKVSKNLGEVTVTGNMMPGYQANSVYKVDVITHDEIEKRGAADLKELLNQELNMHVSNDPSLGSSLNMQGTGGEHIKFLVDGVPVIGRKNGMIDLSQLNLSNVERVEIVKGPMSVLYGTDALGGVINLITKTNKKQNLNAGINTYYESVGEYNADALFGWGFKHSSITFSGGRNYFDGWSEYDTTRVQEWKPREQYFGNAKYIYNTSKGLNLTFQSDYFQEKVTNKSNPVITLNYANALDQYYYTRRFSNQISVDKRFDEHNNFNLNTAYSYYRYIKNTYSKNLVDLTEALTPDTLDDDTTFFNAVIARSTYSHSNQQNNLTLLTGVDFNRESAKGERIDNSMHTITDCAVFASVEYLPLNNLTIRPSLRGIYNSVYPAPFIPSLNVLYKVNSQISARASWSKGFRAPSLKELYLYFYDNGIHNVHGNPDLKAETSQNISASLEYKKAWTKIIVSLEPSFFYNAIDNKISLVETDATTGYNTYMNLDHFIARGGELNTKFVYNQFKIEIGGAYTGTNESFTGQINQPEIAWYPEMNASTGFTFNKYKTTVSVFWKYLGKQPVYLLNADGSLSKYLNEDYQLMDFSIRQPFLSDKIFLTMGIKNLFDVKNVKAVNSGGPHSGNSENGNPVGTGISMFAKLSIQL